MPNASIKVSIHRYLSWSPETAEELLLLLRKAVIKSMELIAAVGIC